jgi:hypothetical protein
LDTAAANGQRSQAQKAQLYDSQGILVIVDALRYELWLANFGLIFPARSNYNCDLVRLNSNVVYQATSEHPESLGEVTRTMCDEPFRWCREQVDRLRLNLAAEERTGLVGELGACVFARKGKLRHHSPFESIEDALAHFYGD